MFDPAIHTLAAYQAAAQQFIDSHGMTPMDAVAEPDGLAADVLARAQYLDAWDVWLFSLEDSHG